MVLPPRMIRLRTVVVTVVTVVASFLAGVLVVRAVPGGATRDALSFAGTLRQNGQPMMGQQSLTFTFKKSGISLCAPVVMTTPDAATGNFSVEIPIDKCPATLFDGGDVSIDLSVGGALVAVNQAVNSVPYAKYSDRVGTPDCPLGYARDANEAKYVVCKKGADELVKVGAGSSAFWMDRYEASLWDMPDGAGAAYGLMPDDAHTFGFARSGQWTKALYAASRRSVKPAAYLSTWQMEAACRLSGKRLPSGAEWTTAAKGTSDPGVANGAGGACLTQGMAPRTTGQAANCVSDSGAEDMIGNVWEVVSDTVLVNNLNGMGGAQATAEFGEVWFGDTYGNQLRGGSHTDGAQAGVLFAALASWRFAASGSQNTGFRCVVSR